MVRDIEVRTRDAVFRGRRRIRAVVAFDRVEGLGGARFTTVIRVLLMLHVVWRRSFGERRCKTKHEYTTHRCGVMIPGRVICVCGVRLTMVVRVWQDRRLEPWGYVRSIFEVVWSAWVVATGRLV